LDTIFGTILPNFWQKCEIWLKLAKFGLIKKIPAFEYAVFDRQNKL